MNTKPATVRLPLWKLELFKEQAERRRNNTHAAYMQAQLELDDLVRQIEERRKEGVK